MLQPVFVPAGPPPVVLSAPTPIVRSAPTYILDSQVEEKLRKPHREDMIRRLGRKQLLLDDFLGDSDAARIDYYELFNQGGSALANWLATDKIAYEKVFGRHLENNPDKMSWFLNIPGHKAIPLLLRGSCDPSRNYLVQKKYLLDARFMRFVLEYKLFGNAFTHMMALMDTAFEDKVSFASYPRPLFAKTLAEQARYSPASTLHWLRRHPFLVQFCHDEAFVSHLLDALKDQSKAELKTLITSPIDGRESLLSFSKVAQSFYDAQKLGEQREVSVPSPVVSRQPEPIAVLEPMTKETNLLPSVEYAILGFFIAAFLPLSISGLLGLTVFALCAVAIGHLAEWGAFNVLQHADISNSTSSAAIYAPSVGVAAAQTTSTQPRQDTAPQMRPH